MDILGGFNDMFFGASSVPAAGGGMGPLQGSAGLFGGGGNVNLQGLMSFGTTFASAAQSIFGGMGEANYLRTRGQFEAQGLQFQGQQSVLEAKQAQIQGQQQSNQILDNLVQTLATQRLNFAGNGMDPTFGTPVSVGQTTQRLADVQTSISNSDAQQKALSQRMQALSYRSQAQSALAQGSMGARVVSGMALSQAQGTLSDWYQRRLARG
jgi:hypothetical protein